MINPYVGIGSLYRANNPAERDACSPRQRSPRTRVCQAPIYGAMGADMAEA
jgi:hypothetical protein